MDLDAFVLVGGRSSRLGQDKALVELEGVKLAERAAATLSEALSPRSVSLVAANEEQFGTGTFKPSLRRISDIYPGKGATGALHVAVSSAATEWAAVLACDLPFVTTELIRRLAATISKDVDAVVPVQADGRIQPLCAFYRAANCREYLEEVLGRTELPPLAAITQSLRTCSIGHDEISDMPGSEHFFLNINTADDLKVARRLCVPAV
jgi:molybdopterin-guanine dinucleotide biosynthesis protein A